MDKKLIDALKDPAHYGWSVHEVARALNVYIPTTPQPPKPFKPDPNPLTIDKRKHALFLSIGAGLAQIFNADRARLNDPKKFDPVEYERQSRLRGGQP